MANCGIQCGRRQSLRLLACNYLPHGYWFYVTGWVPLDKDPRQVDAKLIAKYGIDRSRADRSRRKRLGQANVHYLRHDRFFILLATHGEHRFFTEELACVRDVRRQPLKFAGYSISYRRGNRTIDGKPDPKWHSHVEIDRTWLRQLQTWLVDMAARYSTERVALELYLGHGCFHIVPVPSRNFRMHWSRHGRH